ncbi:hypothetical protein ACFSUS_04375 [Spirosoma soli]|uniref:Uncharacterized protein n=1 Tax=Spirosoma soli TaxID=1770529 RepID=A0ABW5M178_9BACT
MNGYQLTSEAPINKGKPTLFVFEQAETFDQVFKATAASKRADAPNFGKEMVIGIALPSTNKPPKLSVSRIFVNDSTLTVRYIRMADTTQTNPAQSSTTTQPTLVVAIPKQTVLKTRLIENGKLIQTLQKRESD